MNRPPRIRPRPPHLVNGVRFVVPALVLGLGALAGPASPGAEEVSKLAGRWTWSWKDPADKTHRHSMEVEGVPAKLAARERFDNQEPVQVQNLKFDGKKVRFSVTRGERQSDYSGALDGDVINGTVTVTYEGQSTEYPWKATRDTVKKPMPTPPPTP